MEPVPPNVRAVFDRLLDLASPDEQDAYLEAACAGAPEVRREVEALLRAHRDAGSFLQAAPPGLAAPRPAREAPGARIGPYRLLEAIGEGGMGTVWMAEQTQPVQRRVALKVIKAGMDSHQVLARFEA